MKTRWEKYDAKGWTEKGAHKYGRLNEQSWWEKWGEHYDGRGSVLKWFSLTSIFYFASLNFLHQTNKSNKHPTDPVGTVILC